jgi:cupin fold WbuC family metalloprotein
MSRPLDPTFYTRRIDPTTRSVTYWAKHHLENPVFFTNIDLSKFEREMSDLHCNGRVCLHPDPSALFHDMIIFEWSAHHFPVHRHPSKSETITAVRNHVSIEITGTTVAPISTWVVNDNSTFVIPANTWHQIKVANPYSIYRETKLGPVMGDADREFLHGRNTR